MSVAGISGFSAGLVCNEGQKAWKSITVTANSMITIDAAHQGSHSLAQNDRLCLAGTSVYVAPAALAKLLRLCVCVCVWEAAVRLRRGGDLGQ